MVAGDEAGQKSWRRDNIKLDHENKQLHKEWKTTADD